MIAVLLAWLSALLLTLTPTPAPAAAAAPAPRPVHVAQHHTPRTHHAPRAPHSAPQRPTAAPAPADVPVEEADPGPDVAEQLPEEVTGRQVDCPDGTVAATLADGTVPC